MPEFNMETPEQEQALSFDAIRIGLASPEKIREWFTTDGIYTSTHDLISKILQFDDH